MKGRNLNVSKSLRVLSQKKDCRISMEKVIYMLTGNGVPKSNDIGNKSWGHIDFLTKVHDFRLAYTDKF